MRSRGKWPTCTLAAVVLAAVTVTVFTPPAAAQTTQPGPPHRPPASLAGVKVAHWGYQLQGVDIARIAASPHDVVIIDYSRDGTDEGRLKPSEVERLKTKPDGGRRLVVAYLSIGEAEDYRFYWKPWWGWMWGLFAPGWRSQHNSEWSGNYAVRYWDAGWQQILLGPGGYLARIMDAGFDGVWLDKVDSSIERVAASRPSASADMIELVRRVAATGRARRAEFVVIPQNGDELLVDAGYRQIIDAIGKEDLLFGETSDKTANREDVILSRAARLATLVEVGKPVLAVEYLDDPEVIRTARARLEHYGFVAHFADRNLAQMRLGDLPETRAGGRRRRR